MRGTRLLLLGMRLLLVLRGRARRAVLSRLLSRLLLWARLLVRARHGLLLVLGVRLLELLAAGGRVRVLPAEHRPHPSRAARERALLDRALAGRARLRGTGLLRHALVRGGRVSVPGALRLPVLRSRLRTLLGWPLLRPVVRVLRRLGRALLVGRLGWSRRALRALGVPGPRVGLLGLVQRAPPPDGADA
ncbi:hypothetical protein NLX83_25270 [Allokutzneria sp. A3M-2-11 16]|uniref:hypothetical protein n=1 Tax=Allokutzneria sp. A3M-2-11 16 TaxID=2962043 RepID=UPI0020B73447|nr:hypothetical protein [Allokutzneria sp. A3M-2-11 16]MCP3802587.1 hypothetical protein [Allokutzneria sp. A3M-2-11 16]